MVRTFCYFLWLHIKPINNMSKALWYYLESEYISLSNTFWLGRLRATKAKVGRIWTNLKNKNKEEERGRESVREKDRMTTIKKLIHEANRPNAFDNNLKHERVCACMHPCKLHTNPKKSHPKTSKFLSFYIYKRRSRSAIIWLKREKDTHTHTNFRENGEKPHCSKQWMD